MYLLFTEELNVIENMNDEVCKGTNKIVCFTL